ncbi:MAG: class I SAM-dependent methyltransferase [Pyrinomonadaceae bacterium]
MFGLTLEYARKINYKLFDAPKDYGLPIAAEVWDKQYQDGVWNFLDSTDELPNYMVTAGYVQHFAKSLPDAPRLLDIGCGHGNLAQLLSAYGWKSYLGVDVSAEALRQAESRGLKNARFEIADFEQWQSPEKFDFIISTGSISYAKNPVAVLKHYSTTLSENGAFVISLWRYGFNSVIWQNIEKHFGIIDSAVVTNQKGETWDIKVLR